MNIGMDTTSIVETVREKFELLSPTMTERMCRYWAATEAMALPHGGITVVANADDPSLNYVLLGQEGKSGLPKITTSQPTALAL